MSNYGASHGGPPPPRYGGSHTHRDTHGGPSYGGGGGGGYGGRGDYRGDFRGGDRDRGRDFDRGGRDRGGDFRSGGRERMTEDRYGGGSSGGAEARRQRRGPSLWDLKPEGYVEGMAMPVTTAAPPMDPRLPSGASGGSAPSQQTRHARRLYIGGLADQSETEISSFFANLVRAAAINPVRTNPILSVYVNPERKFAFVEFNSIELANAFMDLDGLMFKGHPVKIRRPDDYNPSILPADVRDKKEPLNYNVLPMSTAYAAGTAFGANVRLHIGNIPPILEEAQLTELVAAFGPVRRVEMVRNADGTPKGFAFVEYMEPATCEVAIAGLNNLQVGDRALTAAIAKSAGPEGGAAGSGAAPYPPPPGPPGGFDLASAAAAAASAARGSHLADGAAAGAPTRVVLLEQMVVPDELRDDREYADIMNDIQQECGRYGSLNSVVIPRPPADGAGRVFLQYNDTASSQAAITQLHGRQFAGRQIAARFYDEGAFSAAAYTL